MRLPEKESNSWLLEALFLLAHIFFSCYNIYTKKRTYALRRSTGKDALGLVT